MMRASRISLSRRKALLSLASAAAFAALAARDAARNAARAAGTVHLLNVSYDPTRELYVEINKAFAASWAAAHGGQEVTVTTSHGGSGAQARSVIEGAPADVVTLCLASDIDMLAAEGLLAADWQKRLPHNSTPFTSTIVFLVRKGNPKNIRDWPDLIRDGVSVITANPKTSGAARWNYVAAWGWALRQKGGSDATARAWLAELFRHVPVLDTGSRGATNSFVQRGLGDVLIGLENEALLAMRDLEQGAFEIVTPSITVQTEMPVAVVDQNAQAHGTAEAANAYLAFLFTPEGQKIGAKHYFRPIDPAVLAANGALFRPVPSFDIAGLGGWSAVQQKHFADGGVFDQITAR